MNDVESIRPSLALLVSLVGTALIVLTRRRPNLREACSLVTALLKFGIVASMLPIVLSGYTIHHTLLTFLPGVSLEFRVDALGILFALIASFLWIVTTVYSIGYMRALDEHAQTRYYACFAITLSATMGVAFSANLATLYLFYEILTLITYPLVAHKETDEAVAGAKKYLVYLLGTSKLFFLAAIVGVYVLAGTLEFRPGGLFPANANATAVAVVYFLFLAGIGKAAIMPFHAWLPAAMVAPTPVSGLLHAVAVVNTGVFCVLRIIFHVVGVPLMKQLHLGVYTAVLVSFTILIASLYALTRDNLKARLAYSTVSQLSYIILGGALLTQSGMTGGVMHIANHAFSKITLFFCAGSIYVASHKTKVSELSGIGRQMPLTMAAFSIGALSMIGVPAMAGFTTKWYLALGSTEIWGVLVVLLVSTLLNAAYFMPILYKAYFEAPDSHTEHPIEEVSYAVVVPLLVTAMISVVLGLYPDLILGLVRRAIA
jgi:multicomponent Na+:H+ antiporter subunit D